MAVASETHPQSVDSNSEPGWLVLCHDCDLPNRIEGVPRGGSARCPRCGCVLYRRVKNSINRTLALAIGGAILFVAANSFPFLAFKMDANVTQTTLSTGIMSLYEQGYLFVAFLVLLTTILAPGLQLLGLLYVMTPLKLDLNLRFTVPAFRMMQRIQPWSMMEVFMLGILVSLVKLVGMAQIVPGIALWSFALLIPILAGATASLDRELVWRRIGGVT